MSKKLQKWEDFEKELDITPEQEEEIKLEMEIIEATVKARKENNISQEELSRKTGIKQPSIARIEKRNTFTKYKYFNKNVISHRIYFKSCTYKKY